MSTTDVIVVVGLVGGYVVMRYRGQIREALSRGLARAEVIQPEFEIMSRSSPAPKSPKVEKTPKPASAMGGARFQLQKKSVNLDARCLRTGRAVRNCQCPVHLKLH
jgi:hypothetical protein